MGAAGSSATAPATVAEAFADALRAVDRFDLVVFAIRDGLAGTPVYRAFADRFPETARRQPVRLRRILAVSRCSTPKFGLVRTDRYDRLSAHFCERYRQVGNLVTGDLGRPVSWHRAERSGFRHLPGRHILGRDGRGGAAASVDDDRPRC
ncbi:hypothetical protein [Micromonospora sp. NPDC005367]|uniref:hypothetical protein n=1 Tax=Micromonospora sp. NPDC005367 TaxID=3155590 RepID=UPI0033B8268B